MLQKFVKAFGGNPNKREIEKTSETVEQINALEAGYEKLSDAELRAKTDEFRSLLNAATKGLKDPDEITRAEQAVLDDLLPEAFALVREAAKRTIGQRHFDVQMIGGITLHRGAIAEMRTGEGKTLVATLPLYLNALAGHGVHLVTVNDYLARYQSRWMAKIYNFLGLSVGLLQMAATTENGKKAYVIDLAKESTREDQHQLRLVDRREAYGADITYGTNAEFGFDYLRDNMTYRLEDRVQRGHYYAIVDEVDNVLIDEARTPLIISGPASGDVEWYGKMSALVRQLKAEDYEVNEKDRSITLTEIGTAHVEQLLGQPLGDPDRPGDVTPEQARLLGYLEQGLRAQHLFKRNKDYLVQSGKVVIVDEFTGRLMPGRRWSDGLHQAVEAKENVRVEPENVTYATITLQNYFRMYRKLAGMTGTALTEAEEFDKIYKLAVLPIPTNLEYQAFGADSALVEVKSKDEDGYEYAYFSKRDDQEKQVVYWRRKDYPDVIYRTVEAKVRAIVRDILREHVRGRPMLVGTTSVESSERLSNRLRAEPVRRLMQIILLRHAWLEAHDRIEDGRVIAELADFNRPLEEQRPDDLRPFAKELGIALNPEEPENILQLGEILRLEETDHARLRAVLQGGVAHEVLNARKHTEESMIIAGAGAFGAVTIATNMAGRGVDIKLGGDLAEEIVSAVNRVLRKAGIQDPYDMTEPERRRTLQEVDPGQYGIYEAEVKAYLQHFDDMEHVRAVGGLYVIGSERHEARRIDNQLRGRAARQGDSGASRFYLSLEDDLMRIFGGEAVKNVMERFNIDEDYPLQARMVSNMIEQSQHRVEGANFDVRKHTLEYDDVLNAQRMRIYSQRNRIFEKANLGEDVNELLSAEVTRRVEEVAANEETWRLLAWLDQIQPTIQVGQELFPSFTYKLLLDEVNRSDTALTPTLLDLAEAALATDHAHFQDWTAESIDRTGETLESQVRERSDDLDTFLDARGDQEEAETRRPQEVADELAAVIRTPLRMSSEQLRLLIEEPQSLREPLSEQITSTLNSVTITRLLASIEHRLGEPIGINPLDLQSLDWQEAAQQIEARVGQALEERKQRLLGEDGQIRRELANARERLSGEDDQTKLRMLLMMAQGTRAYFDTKTHRQVRMGFVRLHYIYHATDLLKKVDTEDLRERVLEHLQQAQAAQAKAWQLAEAVRLNIDPESPQAEQASHAIQNQIHRQVLLGAITELWVDYLTRVEALRVSVGLEAYAQRDPLVQYKSRASEMFQNLMTEIRAAVISRIFLYRPRPSAAQEESASAMEPSEPAAGETKQGAQNSPQEPGKKKKRHRH